MKTFSLYLAYASAIAMAVQAQLALQNDGWHFDNVGVLVNEQLDPIINPNAQSSHLHKVLGGSAFKASYNFDDARKSKCSTVAHQADRSNYWQPNLFWIDNQTNPGTTSYTAIPAFPRFYYFLNPNTPNDPITQFPDGLRLMAGSPTRKEAQPLANFVCQVDRVATPLQSDNFNFDRDCPGGMKTGLNFPNCWDGINLWKDDHSHVVTPTNAVYRAGQCPWSHPIKLPSIMLEYTWYTDRIMPGVPLKGNLAWANGDTTSYGIHGDFTNGWDRAVFAAALNDTTCVGYGDTVTSIMCDTFMKSYDLSMSQNCKPDAGTLLELNNGNNDGQPLARLPGCNPLWSSGSKPTCDPAIKSLDGLAALQGTDGSRQAVPAQRRDRVLPTTPGWQVIGCVGDADPTFLNATFFLDNNLTHERCTTACTKGGYQYAGVGGHGTTCYCASGVNPVAPVRTGMCTVPCPGNSTQTCGTDYAYTVLYTAPGLAVDDQLHQNYAAGCYNNAADGLISKSFYTFSSAAMTTAVCAQACVNRNATWSLTTNARDCYCGTVPLSSNLGSGAWLPDSMCDNKCSGNTTETCGGSGGARSNVYNLAKSGLFVQEPNKPAGWLGCFQEGSGKRALAGTMWSNSLMTVEKCNDACSELGYSYAGVEYTSQCFCGNAFQGGQRLPSSQCSMKCGGNSTQSCGASNILDLYDTTIGSKLSAKQFTATKPQGWLGCFIDSGSKQTLTDYSWTDNAMTAEKCKTGCAQFNYTFGGVENGNECNCGKSAPSTTRVPSDNYCNKPCGGNSTQTCGNNGYLEAFNTTSLIQAPQDSASSTSYKGCYQDSSSNRALKGFYFWQAAMTIDMCRSSCRELGHATAALENANQCYCGPTWPQATPLPASSCNLPCSGNSTQTCGGNQVASVYDTASAKLPSKPVGWLGCYNDGVLSTFYYTSDTMTGQICQNNCAALGYGFSGTKNGVGCSCATALSVSSTRIPSAQCNTPCKGSANETCGAGYQYDVYSTNNTAVPSNGISGYAGCYSDWDGAVQAAAYSSTYMTPQTCVRYCKARNFKIASLGFGNRCKCGPNYPSRLVGDSVCNAPCVGNSSLSCGAASGGGSTYNTVISTELPELDVSISNSTGYVGCFTEGNGKLAPYKSYSSSSNSPSVCQASCKAAGYSLAGVESGSDCWCANKLDPLTGGNRVADSECSTICPTGKTTCGGSYKMAVWQTAVANAPVTGAGNSSGTGIEGYTGCFLAGQVVAQSTYKYTGAAVSADSCRRACRLKGSTSAVVTNGNTCYCTPSGTIGVAQPLALCDVPCQGNTTQICGGRTTFSSYDTSGAGSLPPVQAAQAGYVGCFQNASPAPWAKWSTTNVGMRPSICARLCTTNNYTVSSTSGINCYCGNELPPDLLTDSQCNGACPGLSSEICGGSWKISVYSSRLQAVLAGTPAPSASSGSIASSSTGSGQQSSSRSVTATTSQGAASASSVSASNIATKSLSTSSSGTSSVTTRSSATSAAASMPATRSTATSSASATSATSSTSPTSSLRSATSATSTASSLRPANGIVTGSAVSSASSSATISLTASSSALPSNAAGSNSMGCFIEDGTVMSGFSMTCSTLDQDMCRLLCRYKGFPYAAVAGGDTCLCGASTSGLKPAANCNSECSGDPSKTCGGVGSMEVLSSKSISLPNMSLVRRKKAHNIRKVTMDEVAAGKPGRRWF